MAMLLPIYKTHDPIENHAIVFQYTPLKLDPVTNDPYTLKTPSRWNTFLETAMDNDRVRFVVAYLSIRGKDNSNHANIIVIDKHQHKVYRFEPNTGEHEKEDENWGNGPELDRALRAYLDSWPYRQLSYSYIDADASCPRGLHRYEWYEHSKNTLDTGGNCVLWAMFMLDMRLANPDVSSTALFQYAAQEIGKTGSFKYFVDAYTDHVLHLGKQYRLSELQKEKAAKAAKKAAKAAKAAN